MERFVAWGQSRMHHSLKIKQGTEEGNETGKRGTTSGGANSPALLAFWQTNREKTKDTLPNLNCKTTSNNSLRTHTTTSKGGGGIAKPSGGDGKVFVCAVFPPPPTLDIVCCVL